MLVILPVILILLYAFEFFYIFCEETLKSWTTRLPGSYRHVQDSIKVWSGPVNLKARSHDLISRIRFLAPKTRHWRSDCPIPRLKWLWWNLSLFVEWISREQDHRGSIQNLSAPFIFQEERQMKIEHVLFLSGFFFSKLRIQVSKGHFYCVYTIQFSESTKIGSLKSSQVNRALIFQNYKMKMLTAQKTSSSHVVLSLFLLRSNRIPIVVCWVADTANWPTTIQNSHWSRSEAYYTVYDTCLVKEN